MMRSNLTLLIRFSVLVFFRFIRVLSKIRISFIIFVTRWRKLRIRFLARATFISCNNLKSNQRTMKTRINLLYSIYPDIKHCFGIEKKWIYPFKMVYFWLGRYCTNQMISLSEFPVTYGQTRLLMNSSEPAIFCLVQ